MNLRYVTPLDRLHRELATEALLFGRAPFDPADTRGFRDGVRRVWGYYQALKAKTTDTGVVGLRHQLDNFLYRRDEEEFIDSDAVSPARRERLIEGLNRLNRVRRSYDVFRFALKRAAAATPLDDITILDIGSGHGEFPIRLASKGKLAGKRLRVIGSDISPVFVAQAKRNALKKGSPAEFRLLDALRLAEMEDRFDIVVSSQTVHHFPPAFLAQLLYNMRCAAKTAVVLLDARRSLPVLAGAVVATAVLGRDRMLVHDSAVSVRRMYTPAEMELLARCAPDGRAYRSSNFLFEYTLTECYV